MSKREKKTVLYSRNGIKIEKTEHIDMTKWANQNNVGKFIFETVTSSVDKKLDDTVIIPAQKAYDQIIRKESELGFYYDIVVHHDAKKQEIKVGKKTNAVYKKYYFKFDDKKYELTYPISWNDVSINREVRPWDILPGYKGIEDHFITDLYKEVLKFMDVAESEKICRQVSKRSYNYSSGTWSNPVYSTDMSWVAEERKSILRDLFGDDRGPTVNYNDIKILSHGFDLKQSFRKRKDE